MRNHDKDSQRAQLRRSLFGIIHELKQAFDIDDIRKLREKIQNMNQRLTDLDAKAELAKAKLQDHEARISALEG